LAWGRCTLKRLPGGQSRLCLHVFDWPKDGRLIVPGLGNRVSQAYLLADPQHARLKCDGNGVKALTILLPAGASDPNVSVVAVDVDAEPKIARL
jgi:alpha-L-fucosidase